MQVLIRSSLLSLVLVVVCGFLYPLGVTGIGQLFFPKQANGSIVMYNGKPAGSELLGQAFSDMRFFHGRVSSINYNTYKQEDIKPDKDGKVAYFGVTSGSSNLAPSNPALTERVQKDVDEFLKNHPGVNKADIPQDLLTCSGSGLDPHISPAGALIQIPAISKATGISVADLTKIVERNTEDRQLKIFGQPRVNILKSNMEIASILKI